MRLPSLKLVESLMLDTWQLPVELAAG